LTAAVTGNDIGKGALIGAVSGGVAGGVTSAVGSALGAQGPVGEFGPQIPAKPEILGSTALGRGVASGVGEFAGGTAGALTAGAPFGEALKAGAIRGAAGGLTAGLSEGLGLGRTESALLGGALRTGLQAAFREEPEFAPRGATGKGDGTRQPSGPLSPVLSEALQPRSSATLGGGGLNLGGGGISYAPGGTVFGAGETEKPRRNVWNTESLKNISEDLNA
jgi:hypothetical protein